MMDEQQGFCPQCGSDQLLYGEGVYAGETYDYPCTCLDCGYRGREQYGLYFSRFSESGDLSGCPVIATDDLEHDAWREYNLIEGTQAQQDQEQDKNYKF